MDVLPVASWIDVVAVVLEFEVSWVAALRTLVMLVVFGFLHGVAAVAASLAVLALVLVGNANSTVVDVPAEFALLSVLVAVGKDGVASLSADVAKKDWLVFVPALDRRDHYLILSMLGFGM